MKNRIGCRAAGAVVLGLAVAGGAQAQAYPAKPVRIVVPTSPGGGNDFVARTAGQRLSDRLGQQFIVENRPGAGGSIATGLVAKSAPDGYTLLLGFVGQLAMYPHVEQTTYDPLKDFIGVSLLASSYHVIAVHPSLPVRSIKQLIAFAKKRPGELNYASGNPWTPTHLVPELFKSATGTNIVAIQYKGSGTAAVGVLSGEAQVIMASVTAVMPHVRSKRLAALAVTSPTRSPIAPEVPTLVELGVKGVEAPSWYAIAAPAAVPRPIVDKLHGELAAIVKLPDFRALFQKQALEPTSTTPEEFAVFLRGEHDKWGKIIKSLKIQ
ncbi:MAG: tripartite tricarboxylate transporter substrate binding protein [Betaproteobacteria bacterium]|nr:tripartite tricarboxylate transporter substrate binding protein [Betaproteobacteria bacterium]